jgi:putative Mn2+ efflux pump MntP
MLTYLFIALALSMDAFAVSVSSGICIPHLQLRYAIRAAAAFGLFQFLMPVLGWLAGSAFRGLIQGFDHWIAFGLLAFVGGSMLKEALGHKDPAACKDPDEAKGILDLKTLLILAVATSIDALAVGLSYSLLGQPILGPAALIGVVTFALCFVGTEFGKKLGAAFERWAEMAGGGTLILIGIKILGEHLLKQV